jgi:hypothetical protein
MMQQLRDAFWKILEMSYLACWSRHIGTQQLANCAFGSATPAKHVPNASFSRCDLRT